MRAYLKLLGVIDTKWNMHSVEFNTGVNIITGRSSTGKSALIEIFDYCWGNSSDTVPEGVITNSALRYLMVLKINNSFLVVSREPKSNHIFLKEEDSLPKVEDFSQKYFEQKFVLNLRDFNREFGKYFGLDITDTDTDQDDRKYRLNQAKSPRPSPRNFTPFMLQHQNLIANKHTLFYRFDETEKREQTIEQFKIFLGFVDQNYFYLRQELSQLNKELRRLQLAYDAYQNNRGKYLDDIKALIIEYESITGTQIENLTSHTILNYPARLKDMLQTQLSNIDSSSNVYISKLRSLQNDLDPVLAEIRELNIRLSMVKDSIKYAEDFRNPAQYAGIVDETKIQISQCPFCGQINNKLSDEANLLKRAIRKLNFELGKTSYLLDSFRETEAKLTNQIKEKIKESKNISSQISNIENISEELRNHKSLMQQAMLKMCQIEARLSTIEEQSDVKNQINHLRQEIENKTDFLKEKYDIEAALKNAGKYINHQMNELGNKLHFEASYSPINLHFDLDTFDLYHLDNSRKIYLRSMGSGANWLYCHLCLFLSLNRFFCKLGDQCHIPPILFLDQPSQVYFPDTIKDTENEFNAKEIIKKAGKTNVYQNDIQAVENFFDQIVSFCNETKNKTGYEPQIIICDHADNLSLKNADFNKLIRKRWRGDHEGLINLNLTENPTMSLDLFREDFSN